MRIIAMTDPEALASAREILSGGGVAALPTDTLYGLCGRADSPMTLARLRQIKGREADKPFQILFADFAAMAQAAVIAPQFARLLKTKIPGALTAVLPRRANPETTIGARVPQHSWLRELLRAFPQGLAATSVNYAGENPARNAAEIAGKFAKSLDLIIDGGECAGAGSTVASFINGEIKILRRGAVALPETVNLPAGN